MKNEQSKRTLRWTSVCAAALCLSAACTQGQVISSLFVGNLDPVLDQNGRPMAGSYRSADAALRSRVEVRTTLSGAIQPPSTTGAAHPDNPLLTTNSVCGIGHGAGSTNSGLFCMVIPNRPAPGTRIFARAYNAPTLEEASFYADTRLGVAQAGSRTSVVLTFGEAQPLDPGDADGDGLNNSWEKALGTDGRLTADFDGDGMTDLQEMRAGTRPTEAGSQLAFQSIQSDSPVAGKSANSVAVRTLSIRFQAVPGKSYQLQFSPSFTEPVFTPVGSIVTAGDGETEIDMLAEVPAEHTSGLFRLVLAETP